MKVECDLSFRSPLDLTIHRLIVSKQMRIKYESCLLRCSIQFLRSAVIPFVGTVTKGHSHSRESGFAGTSQPTANASVTITRLHMHLAFFLLNIRDQKLILRTNVAKD